MRTSVAYPRGTLFDNRGIAGRRKTLERAAAAKSAFPEPEAALVSEHALFWIAGMIVGRATAGMIGKGFVEERGRRLIPVFVGLALVCGLALGWALTAWVDYIHFTANGGGAPGV